MPEIGEPKNIQNNNSFSRIKMRPEDSIANRLNKMAGNKMTQDGFKYVDSKAHNKMGKDEFLKLLTVQLENQDPLKPVDQKKFAAELAQFSQLEQLTNMNTKLDSLKQNAPVENQFYGASFLGKKITTKGSTLTHHGDNRPSDVSFYLPKTANKVIVRIFDNKGQNIANVEKGRSVKGNHVIDWDGKKLDGKLANKGSYHLKIFAWDENNQTFNGETKSSGMVEGVSFRGGNTLLKLDNGKEIFLHDVEKFELPSNNKKENTLTMRKNNGH